MKNKLLIFTLLSVVCIAFSCKKFLDIDPPVNSLVQKTVFQNDDVATSAVTGIYRNMALGGFASGSSSSISTLCGLSADELIGNNPTVIEFFNNQLTPLTNNINILYSGPYQNIYAANAVLEGLVEPNGITPKVRSQLQGEAYFIRAFSYFYLVNLFGPVPLQLTTDYRVTRVAPRAPIADVYLQIVKDLKSAEALLTDDYVSTERVRPNLSAVQALLARTYLYTNDWTNAEKYASLVIAKKNIYSLVKLDDVFLKNSEEAIWQLFPTANTNTNDGNLFILLSTPNFVYLRSSFALTAFEANDKRKISWVRSYSNSTGLYYYPFKYKVKSSTDVTEYSMVLRLSEQYLIRAEARAQLNNLSNSIDDIDVIRNRAGIPLIRDINSSITKVDLLVAIQNERRIEFFSEWGHRWFDLKRTGQSGVVLSQFKPQWKATSLLFPIPYSETTQNPNVKQNDGY